MAWPVAVILESTAPRDSTRLDLGFARGALLAVSIAVLLPMASSAPDPLIVGRWLVLAFFPISAFVMLFLALRLAGDSVGDRTSGLLALLSLTRTSPVNWLTLRLLQMWIGFLSVWIVRLPLLLFIMCFGGATLPLVVTMELLLLLGFLVCSTFSLFMAEFSNSRQDLLSAGLLVVIAEILLHGPWLLIRAVESFVSWRLESFSAFSGETPLLHAIERTLNGPFGRVLHDAADAVSGLSLLAQCRGLYLGAGAPLHLWPTALLYGGLSVWILRRYTRIVFARNDQDDRPEPSPSGGSNEVNRPTRESRRCWDDAFAWQACMVHGRGEGLIRFKWWIYGGSVIVVIAATLTSPHAGAPAVAAGVSLIALLIAVNKIADCLQREMKEQTLPMLMLTPNEPVEIYDGWCRGCVRMGLPDLLFWGLMALLSAVVHHDLPAVFLGIGGAILASGPLMTISPLVPYTIAGWLEGCGVVALLIVLAVLAILAGTTLHPWAFPVAAIALACLFNLPLKRGALAERWNAKVSSMM